jgi:vesicle coat complex subunit
MILVKDVDGTCVANAIPMLDVTERYKVKKYLAECYPTWKFLMLVMKSTSKIVPELNSGLLKRANEYDVYKGRK